jgi:hypothetical protein
MKSILPYQTGLPLSSALRRLLKDILDLDGRLPCLRSHAVQKQVRDDSRLIEL